MASRVPPREAADSPRIDERYRIEKEIGRGGMGRVFVAHDRKLGRDVAVKALASGLHGGEALRRFEQEARATCALNHANILDVHDIGTHEGSPLTLVVLAVLGWRLRARGEGPGNSIAVLPFVNMSDDRDNEYFSDGITEELLNLLAKVPGLHVVARTSAFAFKGKNEDIGAIARELHVATVLEGSVRKASDQIRIATQLINAADGYHLWS